VPLTVKLSAEDAVAAFDALIANDDVPNNDPVILAILPDTLMASLLNVPNLTESSDDTAKIGIPEISFTENRDPDNWSVTENN
jgi:hypothetical protein